MRKLILFALAACIAGGVLAGCQNPQVEVDENHNQRYMEELRLDAKRLERELEAANARIRELENQLAAYGQNTSS